MFTKFRSTALIMSVFMVGLATGALTLLAVFVNHGKLEIDPSVSVIITTGLVGIVAAAVGYLGGAMSRLTDDAGPPPWVGLLQSAIDKIKS